MLCPYCGSNSHVVESRPAKDLTVRRRHVCLSNDKHKFVTREVHEPVFCSAKPRARDYAETTRKRIGICVRNKAIYETWHEGVTTLALRHNLTRKGLFNAKWCHEFEIGLRKTRPQ